MAKIERAILSCYDKNGLVELAQLLREYEVELISTSGTLQVLQDADIEATSIADFTGVEETMGGQVAGFGRGESPAAREIGCPAGDNHG